MLAQNLDRTASLIAEFDPAAFAISLAIGIPLALILTWHHRRFAAVVSNRAEVRAAIPFILLTTILIISVVKSSLALSLGLVGALSIVRFRTPLKEPEELAYIFLALAIGLALGANQIVATLIAVPVILGFLAFAKTWRADAGGKQLYLSVDLAGDSAPGCLGKLHAVIGKHARTCDLRRYDLRAQGVEATYLVDLTTSDALAQLTDSLQAAFPGIGVTFLDQSRVPAA